METDNEEEGGVLFAGRCFAVCLFFFNPSACVHLS